MLFKYHILVNCRIFFIPNFLFLFLFYLLFFLQAPLILVPQDSNSLSGLMVDLGQIAIHNKFELGSERNELGYPAMFDKIQLHLNNIKLSR